MRVSHEQLNTELVHQHRHVEAIMLGVENAQGALRHEAFDQLRQYLAAHEAAEQEFLHEPARGELDEHRGIVESRVQEEDDIAEMMRGLERLSPESVEFTALFKETTERIRTHMQAEEHQEMAAVARALQPDQLEAAMTALEQVAALSEDAIEDASFDDWLDRARDTFHGRRQVGTR